VFLGDSVAFGYGVGVRESFPHVIGALLSTPVVNLALAGAGPFRQAAVYLKFGIGLRPRHVVACVYAVDFDNDQRFDTWIRRGRTDDYNDLRMTWAVRRTTQRPRCFATIWRSRGSTPTAATGCSIDCRAGKSSFGPPASKTAANLMSRVRVRLVRAGFSVMDLYPAVHDAGGTRSPYFRVDGHFHEHGHRAAADAFVTWFRRAFPDDLDRLRESSGARSL
jgi:hypothetical protein